MVASKSPAVNVYHGEKFDVDMNDMTEMVHRFMDNWNLKDAIGFSMIANMDTKELNTTFDSFSDDNVKVAYEATLYILNNAVIESDNAEDVASIYVACPCGCKTVFPSPKLATEIISSSFPELNINEETISTYLATWTFFKKKELIFGYPRPDCIEE